MSVTTHSPAATSTTTSDPAALELLGLAERAASAYGRPDLVTRIHRVGLRVRDPRIRVLVVGEFKQGKSSLVNGLVNATVCPVDDDIATSVPTAVGFAEDAVAVALHAPEQDDDAPHREAVDVDDITDYVSEWGNPGNERNLWAVEVGIPRQLLRSGLVLVDTPGVGGLGSAHSATTIGALPSADAVILVSDASQEYTEPELRFLDMARELTPAIITVLTKIDFYPEWRKIAELNREHLAARGIQAPIVATSASLRRRAIDTEDPVLNAESGYPQLVQVLRDGIVANNTSIARRNVAHNVRAVAEQLEQRFQAERRILADPEQQGALLAELDAARDRADRLRSRAARWQQTLGDGFADLAADTEHELRARTRRLVKQADEGLATVDPGEVWEQIEQWLYRTVTEQVAAHYATVTSRARALAEEVAQHFADERGLPDEIDVGAPLEMLRRIDPAATVEADTTGAGARTLTAMRGSYGGMMMVGMLGGVVGLGMINPVSLGFGAMLGRKALRDEKERALSQRRAEGKQACRTYIDEVTFVVGKDARDTLRRLQRILRDTFTTRAEELQRSTGEALDAAKRAVQADESERSARLRDLDAEIGRLRGLRARADELEGGRTPAVTS
jgi:predicted GTPase